MVDITKEINEFKAKFDPKEATFKIIKLNESDLKDALKVIAILKGNANLITIDEEIDKVVKDSDKLNEMFNEMATNLSNIEKESKEYKAFLSIICAIQTQIEYLKY